MFFLLFLSVTSFTCLMGCSGFQVASMATMAVTGKGFSDHALSTVTGQDCAFFNVVEGEQVCFSENSVEMTLLTNNQVIDDTLKINTSNKEKIEPDNAFLVIGSFTQRPRAETYQAKYKKWNSQVIKMGDKTEQLYRVVIGPVAKQDKARLKRIFINKGVETPWLVTL